MFVLESAGDLKLSAEKFVQTLQGTSQDHPFQRSATAAQALIDSLEEELDDWAVGYRACRQLGHLKAIRSLQKKGVTISGTKRLLFRPG